MEQFYGKIPFNVTNINVNSYIQEFLFDSRFFSMTRVFCVHKQVGADAPPFIPPLTGLKSL